MNQHESDPALSALDDLVRELQGSVGSLQQALLRAEDLQRQRLAGRNWSDIMAGEDRPLIIERITEVLDVIGAAGNRFRREQALALHGEDLSINRIAAMFGVTRQRVSALIRGGRPGPS